MSRSTLRIPRAKKIFLLCCLLTFSQSLHAQQIGRYQLVAATVIDGDGTTTPSVYKIDTATGQVWRLLQSSAPLTASDGQRVNMPILGWALVPESYAEEINKYIELRDNKTKPSSLEILPTKP